MGGGWPLRISAGALRTVLIAAGVMLAGAAVFAFVFPKHAELLTQIEISAPPAQVWSVLADTKDYPLWNPEISALIGKLTPGSVVENRQGSGRFMEVFHPVVLVASPPRELRWRGAFILPAFLTAEHYFLLEPKGSGTMFTQGESLKGAALWLFDATHILPGFNAMNAALKRRVERAGKS
jgi:hypothetical protein